MSGHSKWSTIKRKKGAADEKRGKIFSKLAKEISVAARMGGGDPEMNARLRTVLLGAKAENMPKDNIERAIKKGIGDVDGVNYEEIRYECYGSAGVALIIDVLSDNKNRIVAEIRHLVTKYGGAMAENGAVSWNFEQQGIITLDRGDITEDDMFEKAIEAGADDVDSEDDEVYILTTAPTDLHSVVTALDGMGLQAKEAKLTMTPKTTLEVPAKNIKSVLTLMELLEENDDVQDVFSNVELTEEAMAAAMAD
jgi:YebC/PmpR family DNA-binding regulatory protein